MEQLDDGLVVAVGRDQAVGLDPVPDEVQRLVRADGAVREERRDLVAFAVLDSDVDTLAGADAEADVRGPLARIDTSGREELVDPGAVDRRVLELGPFGQREGRDSRREQGEDKCRRQDPGHESSILRSSASPFPWKKGCTNV